MMSEVKRLCGLIGFDYHTDKKKYGWFLEQCLRLPLPNDWTREIDEDGNLVYFDKTTETLTKNHPRVFEFRQTFA